MLQQKDLAIMMALRNDARAQLTKISRATGIPVSTIFDRIRSFRKSYVKGYTALLDYMKLGFNTQAIIVLKVKKDQKQDVKAYLLEHPNVNNLFKINNGYDFVMGCVFASMQDFEHFQEEIEDQFSVKAKQVYYVLDDLKLESFLTDPNHLKLVKV